MARIQLQTLLRAAAVEMIRDYVDTLDDVHMQIWPARPVTVVAPSAFVNGMRERIGPGSFAGSTRQRFAQADVAVLHGLFDSADAVAQRDRFVDGFLDWVADNPHATG